MKHITCFLVFILCIGYTHVQAQFKPSEDNSGPWYKIQVKGSNDVRYDRLLMVTDDELTGEERVFGTYAADVNSLEEHQRQLWRIQANEDGSYKVINWFADKELSVFNWADNTKDVAVVVPAATTDWSITEIDSDSEYYFFRATNPEETGLACLHQGNSVWGYGLIMENMTWGTGADSQFRFLESDGEPGIYIDNTVVDFGAIAEGFGEQMKETTILAFGPTLDQIDLSYDRSNFQVNLLSTDQEIKFLLEIYFFGEEPGEYSVPLTIKDNSQANPTEKTIMLKAEILPLVPIKPSPKVENSSEDTWYSIFFDQRYGFYMKDMGADKKMEVSPGGDQNELSELWKFVSIAGNDTAFNIVSQIGNLVKYKVDEIQKEDDTIEKVGRFYTSSTSDHTFSFKLREDGGYLIQWNEYEAEVEEEGTENVSLVPTLTYINKTNNDNGFTQYTSLTDIAGSSIKIFELGSEDYEKIILPKFSNDDDDENWTWYYIRFNRVAQTYPNDAISSNGANNIITQRDVEDEDDPYFWWRLVGTWDNLKIVDANGDEFGATITDAQTALSPQGDGASYKLVRYIDTNQWQLECLTDLTVSYRFLNDFGGSHAMQVGGWTSGDPGSVLFFTPISQWKWPLGIEDPEITVDNDPVVSRVYYTVQGIQLATEPKDPGFYIRKNIHASQKVSAETIYIVK